MNIKEEEIEIFSRQLILKDFNENNFAKLQSKEISIIGIGGIGCPLSQYLVSSGIKNLTLFDNDIIEKSNLNRQPLFQMNDIGKKKTIVAKKRLLQTNPHCNIKTYNKKITKENIKLLKNSSIIIDSTDDWKTMRLVNSYATKNNIPLLSVSAVGFDIQVALFENNKKIHICLECLFPNKKEPDLARCETIGILGTVAGLAGIIAAQKTINFFLKFDKNINILSLIEAKTLLISNIILKKNNKCSLYKVKKNN